MTAAPLSAGEMTARLRGIGLYSLALVLFACLDTLAKYTSAYVPVMEVVWVRYVGHSLLAILFFRPWRNPGLFLGRRAGLQALRAFFLLASTTFNFLALRKLQLAETTSISFAGAFVVAGLAGPLLGEWIGPRRWAAVIVGFIGVLVVTQPGSAAFDPAVLLSVGSMLSNSLYALLTRLLATTVSAEAMLLYPALGASIVLAPIAFPGAISPPSLWIAILLGLTGVSGAVGHWFLIQSHRVAPAAILAPFGYSQLLFMVGFGYFVFGDVPTIATIIGAAIIIASGLYMISRERVRARP